MKLMFLVLFMGVSLPLASPAQPALPKLREAAGKKIATWEALNKSLEARLAPLHRCDPRIKTYIAEVRKASEDRLGAWDLYVRAWLDSTAAAGAASESAGLENTTAQAAFEIVEISLELGDLESRKAELARGSQKSDPALAAALEKLDRLIEINHQRASLNDLYPAQTPEPASPSVDPSGLALLKSRLIETEANLVRQETALWNANYDARIARANADCLIGPGSISPKSRRKRR